MPGCYRRAVAQSDKHHQTGKPTDVMEWLTMCVPPGGVCLDHFMGSGTTGVSCVKKGKNFIGVEIDPAYYAIAEKRIRRAQEEVASEAAFFGAASESGDLFDHWEDKRGRRVAGPQRTQEDSFDASDSDQTTARTQVRHPPQADPDDG